MGVRTLVFRKSRIFTVHGAALDYLQGRNDNPLLKDRGRKGHGTRGHATNIGVMSPVGHVVDGLRATIEDRCDDGDVGEVGPTLKRIVKHHHIPFLELAAVDGGPDGKGHGAQMDWNMRRLGDHFATASKMAQEQSRRSLMLGEKAVRFRVTPISSRYRSEPVLENLHQDGINNHDGIHQASRVRMMLPK